MYRVDKFESMPNMKRLKWQLLEIWRKNVVIIGVPNIHVRNCFYIETDASSVGKILVCRIINPKYQQFIHKNNF